MDNNKNIDTKNGVKINTLSLNILVFLLVLVIGLTYAFFSVNTKSPGAISGTGAAGCYTINYTKGQEITGELTNGTDYTTGKSTDIVMYAEPQCNLIRGTLYITTNEESSMDFADEALRYTVVLNDEVVSEGAINGAANQVIYSDFLLNTTETTYKVYVWLDETKEDMSSFESESYSGFIHAEAIMTSDIRSLSFITLTNLGLIDSLKNENITTFTTSSNNDGTKGVYKSEDDLGTSYYFRGNVINNYVKFGKYTEDAYLVRNKSAKPNTYTYSSTCTSSSTITCTKIASANDDMYWRIVRINGDGTIRMMYAGTSAHPNGDIVESIGNIPYNPSCDDNAYVGYMYGSTGQSTYEATHANTNNSTIKMALDAWYAKYLNTNYSSSIADAIYCNDRKVVTDDSKYKALWGDNTKTAGNGIGTSDTMYGTWARMETEDNYYNLTEINPTLKCEQVNDRFTMENSILTTLDSKGTNKKLTYPIGLVTADETVFAGGYWDSNNKYYLYTNQWYWTMTPSYFDGGYAFVFSVDSSGSAPVLQLRVSNLAVFPAISLSSTAITGGSGTTTNPFTVSS